MGGFMQGMGQGAMMGAAGSRMGAGGGGMSDLMKKIMAGQMIGGPDGGFYSGGQDAPSGNPGMFEKGGVFGNGLIAKAMDPNEPGFFDQGGVWGNGLIGRLRGNVIVDPTEALNQQYNRPTPDTYGPVPRRLRHRFMGY